MNHFAGAKRLVFKVGTSTLTHETGKLTFGACAIWRAYCRI